MRYCVGVYTLHASSHFDDSTVILQSSFSNLTGGTEQWRIQGWGGGGQQARPLKLDQFFFFIRMLKNKAQIARESIKTTLELPGPFWISVESEFARNGRAGHITFCAPLNENH